MCVFIHSFRFAIWVGTLLVGLVLFYKNQEIIILIISIIYLILKTIYLFAFVCLFLLNFLNNVLQ